MWRKRRSRARYGTRRGGVDEVIDCCNQARAGAFVFETAFLCRAYFVGENGRETVQYVSNIYKYYLAYKLLLDQRQQRTTVKGNRNQ